MSEPETTQTLATHLRRMADSAGDQIDADRLSIAANLVDRAHLVAPDLPSDGGPAYPVMWDYAEGETGMSLRDWFAGQALAGIASISGDSFSLSQQDEAAWAYERADAMLAARGKK